MGVRQLVDELAIQLDFTAADLALHLFAHRTCQLTHQARRRLKDDGQRQHAHDQSFVVQLVHQHLLRLNVVFELAFKNQQGGWRRLAQLPQQGLDIGQALAQAGVAGDHFAHEFDQAIELVQAHTHRLRSLQLRGRIGRCDGWRSTRPHQRCRCRCRYSYRCSLRGRRRHWRRSHLPHLFLRLCGWLPCLRQGLAQGLVGRGQAGSVAALGQSVYQRSQVVHRTVEQLPQCRGIGLTAFAQAAQHLFHLVRHGSDTGQAQHTRRAFDGVRRAKQRVHAFAVAVPGVELGQALAQPPQVFARFFNEAQNEFL